MRWGWQAEEGHSHPRVPRFRRRWRIVLTLAAVLGTIWLVGGYFVVVHPVTNRLEPADAIVVLGPPDVDGRAQWALQLARDGYAPVVAISVESALQRAVKSACELHTSQLSVMCFQANPETTQGESRQIRSYADRYNWKRIIVITSSYHISRARMIVERCFHGRVMMTAPSVSHSVPQMAYQYVYQTFGYLKAFIDTKC